MGAWTEGDTRTIVVQGVVPLVLGLGLCFLGCLYLFGILQRTCKRRDDQVAPVTLGSGSGETNEEAMTPQAAEIAYGPVACEAQLFGMSQKERQAVLEQIFSHCCTHKDSKDHQSEEQQEDGVIDVEIDTRCACAICLRDYEDNDEVMTGSACNHKFHKSCALLWLTNYSKPKDHCPYCRKEMMSAVEMKKAALEVLGEERVAELAQFPSLSSNNTTTTSSPSQDTQDSTITDVEVPDVEQGIEAR